MQLQAIILSVSLITGLWHECNHNSGINGRCHMKSYGKTPSRCFCVRVYFQRAVHFQENKKLHLSRRGVISVLQQNLRGGVLFVETVVLDRHNCEEKQINLPRPTLSAASSSAHFPFLYPSPWLWFPLFNFLLHFFFFLFQSCPHPEVRSLILCVLSSTPRVSRCHTSPQTSSLNVHTANRVGNPHGNLFTLHHNTVLIS